MGLFGKPSHIPSQRKGLVGFLQDVIQVSSLQKDKKDDKTEHSSSSQSPGVSFVNQRKLDRAEYYDRLANEAMDKSLKAKTPEEREKYKKQSESLSQEAQDIDDSIR
jgi:hypothetical protein